MRRGPAVLIAISAAALAGCYPEAVSPSGRQIRQLYDVFFVGGAIVAGIVFALTTWAIIRYRRRGRDTLPQQLAEHMRIELLWTGIPLATVLVLFGLTWITIDSVEAQHPEPAVEVHVDGFRWGWRFDYPASGVSVIGDISGPPEMVVPVDEPVRVTLTASDVIHAFYVPKLLFKRDNIPGRVNSFDIVVETPGTYPGLCAEFCGLLHARMPFTLRAVPRPEFDAWVAAARAGHQPTPSSTASTTGPPPGATP